MLGMLIFGEKVAGLWWVGATGMGVGCIIVGMRDEGVKDNGEGENGRRAERADRNAGGQEGIALLGSEDEEEEGEEEEGEEEGDSRGK